MSSVAGVASDVRSGRRTAVDVVQTALERLGQREAGGNALKAIVAWNADTALDEARRIDARRARGEHLPLAGVPIAVKDNICTLDLPTTCGSHLLSGYVSPYEATVVRRLRAAGAILLGKTNLDEFAMGSTTTHSCFGRTVHPADPTRVPGGSSGGSAAAVAAMLVPAALGSDTGGSVRQPAAFCGVVGVKPTYGRISRYGLVGFASSLDHVGIFGRHVGDAAALLQACAGADPCDATSGMQEVGDLQSVCTAGVSGLRIGVPESYLAHADPAARAACMAAIHALRDAGAVLCDVTLGDPTGLVEPYRVLSCVEAVTNLARFDGVRFGARVGNGDFASMRAATREQGMGPAVRERLAFGERIMREETEHGAYRRAAQARARQTAELRDIFRHVDAVLSPATPYPAFRHDDDSAASHDSDVLLLAANHAGVPAASIPFGDVGGLPLGVQVMTAWWEERTLLRVAGALERAAGRP